MCGDEVTYSALVDHGIETRLHDKLATTENPVLGIGDCRKSGEGEELAEHCKDWLRSAKECV